MDSSHVLLLDVGSRECGVTQKATKGLLIRICPCFVRLYIKEAWPGPYECDDVSPDARSERTSDHKSHTTSKRSAVQDFAGPGVDGLRAKGRPGFCEGAERYLRTFRGEFLGLIVTLLSLVGP